MQLTQKLSNGISETPFKNRPLAFILAVFLCALLFIQISTPVFIIYAACLALYSLYLGVKKGGFAISRNPLVYILPAVVIIAVLLYIPTIYSYFKISELTGERTVKAVILQTYYEEQFGALYLAKVVSIDGVRLNACITIEFTEQVQYALYDTVTLKGVVTEAQDTLAFDELLLAKSQRLIAHAECTEFISVTNESKSGISYAVFSLGENIKARLYELLPSKTAGYACAILLGDKRGITNTFKSDMSALGISHILAVSGMHMSIIASIVTLGANRIKASRKTKSVMICACALVFMTVAGFSASVVRAGIMLIIGMLSVFSGGRADPITSLMLSGTIICVFSPQSVLSCGFLLSFFATLGIVMCALYAQQRARRKMYASKAGDMKRLMKVLKGLAFSLLISLCATLFTAPVMSVYFSEISFVSVLTNLFAVPMAFASMVFTLLTLVFGKVPLLGAVIIKAFTALYTGFEVLIKFLADTFTTTVSLRYPFFKICLILLAGIILFMLIRKIHSPLAFIGALTVTAILFGGGVQIYSLANVQRAEVVYVSEKNSEGLIISSGSDTLFIDIGNGSKKVTEYCTKIMENEYYETDFDGYMLTHYHSRHISTIERTLTASKIKALYLPVPQNEKENVFCQSIKVAAIGCKIVMYERGKEIKFDNVSLQTLEYSRLERSEHPVIAVKMSAFKKSIVYIGASVTESAAYIQADGFTYDAGAIICGSHGATVKENDAFLSIPNNLKVYLSPYENANEKALFPNASFVKLKADKSGFAYVRLALSD